MSTIAKLSNFFSLVSAAEGDMNRVYDHAYLLHEHLSQDRPLADDEKNALIWPAGDLLAAGRRLREHCDAMYEAARQLRKVSLPKQPESDAPVIDPSELSVAQMFALFSALGTVGDVMDGLLCQPRFHGKDNPAGKMLERLQDTIVDARDAIRAEAISRPASGSDSSYLVSFAAEEWTDGSVMPGPALKGLTTALTDLGKAVSK